MLTLAGLILALSSFLLGYAFARREPARPVLYRAGRWTVSGDDGAYLLSGGGQPIARFTSYRQAISAADLHGAR